LASDIIGAMEIKKTNIGLQTETSFGVKEAIEGKSGFGFYEDYRHVPVIEAYAPLNIPGLNWAIVSKMDEVEALEPITSLLKRFLLIIPMVAIVLIVIAIYVGTNLAKGISHPIEKFSAIIKVLAEEQDLTKRVLVKSQDELGEMADALNHLLDSFQEAFQETLDSSRIVQAKADELKEISDYMTEQGESSEDSDKLARAGDELQDLSSRIEKLSSQFIALENESERTEDW